MALVVVLKQQRPAGVWGEELQQRLMLCAMVKSHAITTAQTACTVASTCCQQPKHTTAQQAPHSTSHAVPARPQKWSPPTSCGAQVEALSLHSLLSRALPRWMRLRRPPPWHAARLASGCPSLPSASCR